VPDKPEVLPPEPSDITTVGSSATPFNAAWRRATPLQKGMFFFLSAGTVASASLFALGQFFQTRGVQNMLTSRIFLFIAWVFPTLGIWQFARLLNSKRWRWIAFTATLALLVAAVALDRAFPMPKSAPAEKAVETVKQSEPLTPAQTPQEQAEPTEKPPTTEVRTHLALDGNIRFPQDVAADGHSFTPERNFRVGERIFFNYFLKVIGPNPIQVFAQSRRIYLESDVSDETEQEVVKDFEQRVARDWKTQPKFAKNYTLMYPGSNGDFNSAFTYNEDGTPRLITQNDLDDFKTGTVTVFVVIQVPYKDNNKWRYLRTCQYLLPPATIPEVWHSCDYFTNSD
jgi:hypothetical protein